jgi:hypothetical protein
MTWFYDAAYNIRETQTNTHIASVSCARENMKELASIISAAPAMLEVLKRLVADCKQYEAWQRPCYNVDLAELIIAKAEGNPAPKDTTNYRWKD